MEISDHWATIRQLFGCAQEYSIATVNADGSPHVTPIGSVVLRENQTGYFFERFTRTMPANLDHNPRVCVMAVNASKCTFLRSLIIGKCATPPAVRLMGTAGNRRLATEEEMARWNRRVRFVRWMKGYNLLWRDMRFVRDIVFDSFEPVSFGRMTSGLWNGQSADA
ncbi:MAG: pyridoxamine 5'-phosphate oxidase family protein [Candidatus Zixiibacteriota bacterium]